MKILSNIKPTFHNVYTPSNDYTILNINENQAVAYRHTKESNNDILLDLLECKAYGTALLYLNENYELEVGKFNDIFTESNNTIEDYYSDCEELLNTNIKIVEEAGIPLVNINGYQIYEGDGYVLRGNGKKKIMESFNEAITKSDEDIIENITEEAEGTQTTDIAPKVDQELGLEEPKKKYYDILLSDISESLDILNKGFLKNSKGQYQRGNYILVKEGEKYLAIHKDKLKEDIN